MTGEELFYEGWLAALRDDVQALGGAKVVGPWFKPDLAVLAARNWLNDTLNGNRRERLADTQERLIIRRAREKRGFSAALCFLCDDTGFERPKAIRPEDEQAELQRRFIQAVDVVNGIAARMERSRGGE